ncbi:MAG: thiamine-phosphate kinase, partial [Thermoplasmata archaeon]
KLSDLGERKLVDLLLKIHARGGDVGLGDDAALLPMGRYYLLLTTDVINERTHIPKGARAEQVGWYVVAVNFSDIAAMGGEPVGFMAALTLPRRMEVSYLEDMARGMDACVREFGAQVLGGDTKEGSELSICGVAVGRTKGRRVLRRRGCRPGELVAATGFLGEAGWALTNLGKRGRSDEALELLLRPRPRVREGLILAASSSVTSCMDISDGLASSLDQLSGVNDVSFQVEYEKLPTTPLLKGMSEEEQREAVLFQGGDFELLFTLRPKGWSSLQSALRREGCQATVIGTVREKGPNTLLIHGREEVLEVRGYEHFR